MIVVAVIGILAVLAIVVYRSWIRTSYMAEAEDMLSHMRSAEEAFHAENGVYLDISGGLDSSQYLYPASNPGSFKTTWGAPCSNCPHQWSQLNIQAQAPVAFAYALNADNSSTKPPPALTTTVAGSVPSMAALQGAPWYIAEAKGDINGDGIYTRIYTSNASPQLFIDNEGN